MDTYEKKHNEALNWMRELYPGLHGATKEDAEHYFPELRESEDERIRKEIIDWMKGGNTYEWQDNKDRWIAYLEKQKEQKPVDFPTTDEEVNEFLETHPKVEVPEKYKTPDFVFKKQEYESYPIISKDTTSVKPAEWSEEDADILNCCISSIEEAKENRYAYKETDGDTSYDHEIAWLKSLRPVSKESLQPHEEIYQSAKRDLAIKFMNYLDENRPDGKMCLSNAESEDIDKAFKENDLAKIVRYYEKYRPHWKPSEEQMKALEDAFRKDGGNEYRKIINSLYNDLQKLL